MKKGKKAFALILAGIMLFSMILTLSGCNATKLQTSSKTQASSQAVASSQAPVSSQSSDNVIVTSKDGSVSITVPNGWNNDDLSSFPSAYMGVSDVSSVEYLVIVKKSKSTEPANFTADACLNAVKTFFATYVVTGPAWGQTSNITVNGLNGESAELSATGKISKANLTYWVDVLEDTNNFYEVIGWTVSSKADANKQTIENIMNSFKVNS